MPLTFAVAPVLPFNPNASANGHILSSVGLLNRGSMLDAGAPAGIWAAFSAPWDS